MIFVVFGKEMVACCNWCFKTEENLSILHSANLVLMKTDDKNVSKIRKTHAKLKYGKTFRNKMFAFKF